MHTPLIARTHARAHTHTYSRTHTQTNEGVVLNTEQQMKEAREAMEVDDDSDILTGTCMHNAYAYAYVCMHMYAVCTCICM